MTTATAQTAASQAAVEDRWVDGGDDFVWDDDGGCVSKPRRVCRSHGEAQARAIAISRQFAVKAGGFDERPRGWVNSWKAAFNSPDAFPFLLAAVEGAPVGDRTCVGTLLKYLNAAATFTSWDGKDPVFPGREVFAGLMGCDVRTVSRCALAAERAGLMTPGVQQCWVETSQDGEMKEKGSSCVRILILSGGIAQARFWALEEKKRRKQERAAAQVLRVEQEALQQKREVEQAHNAYMDGITFTAADVGQEFRTPEEIEVAKRELAKSRRHLLE